MMHPLIAAELALGWLRDRNRTLALLDLLPQVARRSPAKYEH